MVKQVIMYTVICDNCGKDSNDGTEYSCWADGEQAELVSDYSNWVKEGDKHYCPDCFFYDDEDKLIINELYPNNSK